MRLKIRSPGVWLRGGQNKGVLSVSLESRCGVDPSTQEAEAGESL